MQTRDMEMNQQVRGRGAIALLAALGLLTLQACAARQDLGYYWQSVNGHISLLRDAKPVNEWLADEQASERLKARLRLSQEIRDFASAELRLPENASYRRYADLKRRAVVWNVTAAPQLSLQLKTWCFPVAGCVGYRGYYSEADAKATGDALRAQGYEVSVYPVPAYSTLGKLKALGDFGADPLLNTFISYPDGELARLIFHELAHQVLYVADDTTFNESFATAVERIGGRIWLERYATPEARKAFDERDLRQQAFRELTQRTRERLAKLYSTLPRQVSASDSSSVGISSISDATTLEAINRRQAIMAQMRSEYAELKAAWGGFSGYDAWIANANNASLGAQAAYNELVPQFEAVFARGGGKWPEFYDAIRSITHLPRAERRAALKQLAGD